MSTCREFCHTLDPLGGGDGHDAGDDGDVDSGKSASISKVQKIVVIEKELCADVVGTGIHLRLEVIHFQKAIRCIGMSFGKSCHTDTKPAWVGVFSRCVKFLDMPHEVGGVLESISSPVVARDIFRWVAPECEKVADTSGGVFFQSGCDFLRAMRYASEVGNGRGGGGFLDADHEVMGEFARRATGTVGDAHKRRIVL